ncbi:MAG: WD40 repeat domain-containing protein [Verrucomicrobiaceae bacterium]
MNRKITIAIAITLLSIVLPCVYGREDEQFSLTLHKCALWKDNGSYGAVYLPDGNSVVIEGWLWDCRNGNLIRRLNEFSPGQERFALSPCGKFYALIDQGFRGKGNVLHWYGVTLVDVATGKMIHTFEISDPSIRNVSFSSDNTRIFVISYDTLFTLSVMKRKIESTIPIGQKALLPEERIVAEVIPYESSPDDVYLTDKVNPQFRIQLSSLEEGQNTKRLLSIEKGRVKQVAFTSDGKYVLAEIMAGVNKQDKPRCIFWKVKTGEQIKTESIVEGKSYVAMSGKIFSKNYIIMVDEKHEENTVLDLSNGKLIPVQTDKTGKSLVIEIAPNGEDCVVR